MKEINKARLRKLVARVERIESNANRMRANGEISVEDHAAWMEEINAWKSAAAKV